MENEIVEYKLIKGSNNMYLQDSVNEAIKNGWQPFGGIAAMDLLFLQAMVKRKKPEAKRTPAKKKTSARAGVTK